MDRSRSPSKTDFADDASTIAKSLSALQVPKVIIPSDTDDTEDVEYEETTEQIEITTTEDIEKPVTPKSSRHTKLAAQFKTPTADNDDPFKEEDKIQSTNVKAEMLLKYKIYAFNDEGELPNFVYATNALQYFRVLRDLLYSWTRSQSHLRNLNDASNSDMTPSGLKIRKNLEVVECTPHLRLQALQIFSDAETKLMQAMTTHYKEIIPKIEKDFKQIQKGMTRINDDERQLILMKLLHYKNDLIRQHRDRREGKKPKNTQTASKNEEQPTTSRDAQKFPWEQLPPRANKDPREAEEETTWQFKQ